MAVAAVVRNDRGEFSLGLVRLPVSAVLVAIAVQAFLAAHLGLAVGAKIAGRWRERAERVAGIALILLGAYLITQQLIRLARLPAPACPGKRSGSSVKRGISGAAASFQAGRHLLAPPPKRDVS